ncbi:DNA primase family protein [Planktosalinus lacus]|uniref:Primase n=1 Tax=Planktosalinus lacus TaxID=1526573 RepID=A0A8J2VBJ8_9FLAO|nr:phage/plasmid primase, P4 family [Planktosalinus lacus]GGD99596.1 primase [Planktosalinus lacus]
MTKINNKTNHNNFDQKSEGDNPKIDLNTTQPLISKGEAPSEISSETPSNGISLEELLEETELLNSKITLSEVLKFILQNLEEKDFKAEAKFKHEDIPLPRKHYLVLTIQFILEKTEELGLDVIFRNQQTYLFNKEYWEKINEEEFKYFLGEAALQLGVYKFDAKFFRFKDDLYKQFQAEGRLQTPLADQQVTLINLKNGTVEISEHVQKLREFRKEDFLTYQLPFEYDETARLGLFHKFLNEVLPEAELQNILAEYLGSIFIKNNVLKLEKALFLYGGGSNGKSVVFDIISALLGEENFSSYSLDSITNDKDSRAMISDKLLNYCSETSKNIQSEIFKKLVSREPIDARLLYKSSFLMTDYARLMFNSNDMPTDIEHNHAFFRRFLIVPFRVTIKDEDQDKNLSTKIIKHELPGIFTWILSGMQRLLKNKNFTHSTIVEDEVNRFRRESDSVLSFNDDSGYCPSCTEEVSLKELYQEYKVYCIENSNRPCSNRTFKKRLENVGFETKRKNSGWVVFAEKKDLIE